MKCFEEIFNGKIPTWCKLIEPQEDIISILSQADCFISSSVHETFSYAICEATIYGIPVIQSDIPGTKWNERNPSTYVFPSENYKKLASRIVEVMNIPVDDIAKSCTETRINNINEYSLQNWSNKIIDFYNQL